MITQKGQILVVEDQKDPIERIKLLLKWAFEDLGIEQFKIVPVKTYGKAMKMAKTGIYPYAIVDLNLDLGEEGFGYGDKYDPYMGKEIIKEIRKHNKDTIVSAYSAYALERENNRELVSKLEVSSILDKNEPDDNNLLDLILVDLRKMLKSFNYTVPVRTKKAIDLAFGDLKPADTRVLQWEICLRRLLLDAEKKVAYDPIGKGHSGAGVVVARQDNKLARILKFDFYEKLVDEFNRYDKYVRTYIQCCARAEEKDLAQAGQIGALSYYFVGSDDNPITLASAISQDAIDKDVIRTSITKYFKKGCQNWWSAADYLEDDLGSKCRQHYNPNSKEIKTLCSSGNAKNAVKSAAEYLNTCTPEELIETVMRSIDASEWCKITCKAPAFIHGDLNAQNLIFQGNELWVIDYAKTGEGPRILDFVKLEASIKFDILIDVSLLDTLKMEEMLLDSIDLDVHALYRSISPKLHKKIAGMEAIRSCAKLQCGSTPDLEYWLALFFVTTKHIEYLARDITVKDEAEMPFVQALISAYHLAHKISGLMV